MRFIRLLLALLPVLFLSGAIVMLFFTHLAGITHRNPLNRIFFLQADTRGIPGAPDRSHWTIYNICRGNNGVNVHCSGRHAATPILPQQNFQTRTNIPYTFLHRPNKFFYLSRFFYAFSIITLFFTLCALALSLFAFCSYLGAALAGAMTAWALFLQAFTTSIMTAVYTMAQNAFRDAGRDAKVGAKAFAFMWTSLFLIFVSMVMLWMSYLLGHHKRDIRKRAERKRPMPSPNHQIGHIMGAGDGEYRLNSGSQTQMVDHRVSAAAFSGESSLTPAKPFNKRQRTRLMPHYARGGFFRDGPPGAPDTGRQTPLHYEKSEKSEDDRRSLDSGVDYRTGAATSGSENMAVAGATGALGMDRVKMHRRSISRGTETENSMNLPRYAAVSETSPTEHHDFNQRRIHRAEHPPGLGPAPAMDGSYNQRNGDALFAATAAGQDGYPVDPLSNADSPIMLSPTEEVDEGLPVSYLSGDGLPSPENLAGVERRRVGSLDGIPVGRQRDRGLSVSSSDFVV